MATWQPAPELVQEVKTEIEGFLIQKSQEFSFPLEKSSEELLFIEDFAKIGAFLLDHKAVKKQLQCLNAKLCVRAREKLFFCNDRETEFKADLYKTVDFEQSASAAYLSHDKILRTLLEEELGHFGFFPRFGKALGLVKPKAFRKIIEQGLILKDPPVEESHGEFNHAIQWLLIAYQQEESPFLNHSVIELFKELGKDNYSVSLNAPSDSESNLWDLILDATPNRPATDFRSPNSLTKFLRTSEDPSLFLLKTLIHSRILKRRYFLFDSTQQQQKEGQSYGELKDNILLPKAPVPKI